MDTHDKAALRLLAELHALDAADTQSNPNPDPAVRVTIRTASGEYLGEALLNLRAADEAATAVSAATGFALDDPDRYQERRRAHLDSAPAPEPAADLDPLLTAAIEDHFADIDPESYLTEVFGSPDAEASLAAYEQLVTGERDGGL